MRFPGLRIVVLLTACSLTASAAQAPETTSTETYRAVIARYIATGSAAAAVKPLGGWSPKQAEAAVAAVIRRRESAELEAAAALHLEIAIGVVGISLDGAKGYLDQGSRLIEKVVPEYPAGLSVPVREELALLLATWHRVAATVFLAIGDATLSRPLAAKAQRFGSKSAPIMTVVGMADEIDAGWHNVEEWDSVTQRTRASRNRAAYLARAEEAYKNALDADPSYPLARIRLGRIQFLQGEPKRARESLERGTAEAQLPRHKFLAAMFTGDLLQAQKDLDGASRSFGSALAMAPHNQHAVAALSFVEMMAGRTDRAREVAQAYTGAGLDDDAWWMHRNGALDHEGLQWLRARIRK
jgi:tetratricopeptide (TPR) repeat protein